MAGASPSWVARARAKTRASYDRLSRWYGWLSASETPFRVHGVAALAVGEGERVLEIGFGVGSSLRSLAFKIGTSGLACGIDLSSGMVREAQKTLRRAGLAGRVSLQLGDAAALPYPSGYFNALFMAFTLELFDTPEIPLVLAECRRVLKQPGRLCVISLARPDPPGRAVRVYEWFHRRFPVLVDCRPIPTVDYLQRAGFTIRHAHTGYMWGLPVDSVLAIHPLN